MLHGISLVLWTKQDLWCQQHFSWFYWCSSQFTSSTIFPILQKDFKTNEEEKGAVFVILISVMVHSFVFSWLDTKTVILALEYNISHVLRCCVCIALQSSLIRHRRPGEILAALQSRAGWPGWAPVETYTSLHCMLFKLQRTMVPHATL